MKGSQWWRDEVPEDLGPGYTRAVLQAIRDGHAVITWKAITHGELLIEVMARPLAIGEPDDHVFLYGMSAELVDLIALELGDVMSPTPMLYDLASEHPDARWIGPHTLPTLLGVENGAAGATKTAAKAHADAVAAECERLGYPPGCLLVGWGKTYGLERYGTTAGGEPTFRPHFACEYGWALRELVSWGSRNASGTGYVVQPAAYAHFYRHFRDYSMAAWYLRALARLRGEPVDLREHVVDAARAGAVSLSGAVPYVIHPDCPRGSTGPPSAPTDDEPPDTQPSSGIGLVGDLWTDDPPPTLRLGDRGMWVGVWQGALIAAGFSLRPFGADQHFGRLTVEQTRAFQETRGLEVDGIVGPLTWGSADRRLENAELVEPFTDSPFPPLRDRAGVFGDFAWTLAPVPGNPEAIKIHGSWVADHIVRVEIPELVGIPGAPRDGGVYFHEHGVEQLSDLFAAWRAEGLLDRVLSWAGSCAWRTIRGSRSVLSNHAFGSAFDINAPWNPMGAEPAYVGEHGCVRELVPIAHDFGFFWGGNFRGRPDGMHFEIARILP